MKLYPEYKDSGVDWLGEIPESWGENKLKYLATVQPSSVDKKSLENEDNVFLCNYMDVYKNEFITSALSFMVATASPNQIEKFEIKKSDVLVTKDSETPEDIANAALVKDDLENVLCGYHLTQIKTNPELLFGEYLFRLFGVKRFRDLFTVAANGITRFGLTIYSFSNSRIILPPLPEQTQISNYLDHKTKLIDTLIEKKQKQIELLKEQRTAIINQAVTKGFDPNVKMKNSGIEWLGEIPESWEIAPLKRISLIKYGLGQPPRELEGGLPLIRATNIKQGKLFEKEMLFIDPEEIPYNRDPILKENDIIVVRSGAYTGDSAIIPKEYEGSVAGYDLVVTAQKVSAEFIAFCLLSDAILHKQIDLCRTRAAQPHLNAIELGETLIFLPRKEEQLHIVKFLKNITKSIETLIHRSHIEINLLKEYRTTLISEAVTGKIDVREYNG